MGGPPDLGRGGQTVTLRPAGADDAAALRDLEEAANLVALAHVFPAAEFPFPRDAVLARWREVLADSSVTVVVVDGPGRLDCFAAYDDRVLRHLAVHPDRWGDGLARTAIDHAVGAIRATGARPRLWCLTENHRAYAVYRHLGWRLTGRERRAEWPPYPVERELELEDCPT